jgi:hypothetical protein
MDGCSGVSQWVAAFRIAVCLYTVDFLCLESLENSIALVTINRSLYKLVGSTHANRIAAKGYRFNGIVKHLRCPVTIVNADNVEADTPMRLSSPLRCSTGLPKLGTLSLNLTNTEGDILGKSSTDFTSRCTKT